ncbi:MAG: co-chaperone GroES [Patescibacteria group bacterium]|jgi:chaperonin GroES|nr:co-chaperone GroES [bacterium]HOR57474.1 co-chaperone GroES [bacterium]HPL56298.1 co-chaperone GroES [bacterium]
MKVRPLGDKVFLEPLEEDSKTKGGIYLPESAKEKPKQAKVLAVGEGRMVEGKLRPLAVKVGDKVLIKEWGGDDIKIDGKEYKIVSEDDILGIIE